jgi:carbamoyl-phosphate synthase large subunit
VQTSSFIYKETDYEPTFPGSGPAKDKRISGKGANMTTILVSGASGVVGYGTLKSLRQGNPEFKLIGTSIYDDSVTPAFCDIFELAPLTSDESYIDWLCGVIEKHQVDMIIPGIEADMLRWNKTL